MLPPSYLSPYRASPPLQPLGKLRPNVASVCHVSRPATKQLATSLAEFRYETSANACHLRKPLALIPCLFPPPHCNATGQDWMSNSVDALTYGSFCYIISALPAAVNIVTVDQQIQLDRSTNARRRLLVPNWLCQAIASPQRWKRLIALLPLSCSNPIRLVCANPLLLVVFSIHASLDCLYQDTS